MSLIRMTTLFYKALILQGEIWCWSLLGVKGLKLLVWALLLFWCQLYEVANDWLYRLPLRERKVVPTDWPLLCKQQSLVKEM